MVATKEGKFLFVPKSYQRTLKRNIPQRKQEAFCKNFVTRVAKYLKDNERNSLKFARKYVRIFVLGHYLFLETHSFRISEQIMSPDIYLA